MVLFADDLVLMARSKAQLKQKLHESAEMLISMKLHKGPSKITECCSAKK